MFSYDMILADLKGKMKETRFKHTLGVIKTAEELALYYGEQTDTARLAALLHDCSKLKDMTESEMERLASESLFPDVYPLNTLGEALLHAMASEVIARKIYGIQAQNVLSAVRWHTTGRTEMSALDMIIYSADMIEPSRSFEGVEELRCFAKCGLERLTLECMKHCVLYLERSGNEIHRTTLEAYNYLKENLK